VSLSWLVLSLGRTVSIPPYLLLVSVDNVSAWGVALNVTTASVKVRVLHNSVYLSARLKLRGTDSRALLIFTSKTKSGYYQNEMNFEILNYLPPEYLTLLDNAPHRSIRNDKSSALTSRNGDIQEWLQRSNFERGMAKNYLVQIVRTHRPPTI
jgi:hypothetical protein